MRTPPRLNERRLHITAGNGVESHRGGDGSDDIRSRRTLGVWPYRDDHIPGTQERTEHRVDVLVLEDAKHKDTLLLREITVKTRPQRRHPCRIVRAVHNGVSRRP